MIIKNIFNQVCLFALFFCLSSQSLSATAASPEPNQHNNSALDETDKLALQTFSNTVSCMFNIVHQPDNKQNVISNVGAIIGGIFNFVAQIVGHNKQTTANYKNINDQLQAIIQANLRLETKHKQADITDATSEIEELEGEQATPIGSLTANIHAMLATINNVVNNLYTLAQNQNNISTVSAQINDLLEKIVQIAVETMKNQYLQGHASEEDFAEYLENLEGLQEKIKHTIMINALHLREEQKSLDSNIINQSK